MPATSSPPGAGALGFIERHKGWIIAAVCGAVIGLGVLTFLLAHRPQPSATLGWVTALGFSISTAGLIVSIGGFGVTLKQLSETVREVDAAVRESKRIRDFLTAYDAVQEASKASYALSSAKKHLANDAWGDASESYEDFRRGIVSLQKNVQGLTADLSNDVDKASIYVSRLGARIDKYVNSQFDPRHLPDKAKILTVLRAHGQLISDMSDVVQQRVFNVNHS